MSFGGQSKGSQRRRKYYLRNEIVPFEEDMTHEFKGHRNLCQEEMPKYTLETKFEKASRKPISRNLCGFLNTGIGGTVYTGVHDNGKVVGLRLTQYQRDHTLAALKDLMTRYDPQVPAQRYEVRFVPILSQTTKEEERDQLAEHLTKTTDENEDPMRKRLHLLRTPTYCWCDHDARARCENGIIVDDCIVEFKVRPWEADDKRIQGLGVGDMFNVHPVHATEEGKVYFRRHACLVQYNAQEIANLARIEAKKRGDAIVARLKKEIELAKTQLVKKDNSDSRLSSKMSSVSLGHPAHPD